MSEVIFSREKLKDIFPYYCQDIAMPLLKNGVLLPR